MAPTCHCALFRCGFLQNFKNLIRFFCSWLRGRRRSPNQLSPGLKTAIKTLSKLIDVWFPGRFTCIIFTGDKWCLTFCNWNRYMCAIIAVLVRCLVSMIRYALRMISLKFYCAGFPAGATDFHTKLFEDGIKFRLRSTYEQIRQSLWKTFAWKQPMSSTTLLLAKFTARAFSPAFLLPTAVAFTYPVVLLVQFSHKSPESSVFLL